MGMTIRAYARHRGVSHTAVQKAIHAGRIPVETDGSIDPAKADAAWDVNTTPTHGRQPPPSKPTQAPKTKPVPQAAVEAARETLKEHGEPVPAPGQMTYLQARTANEILKAQERRLRLQKLKGEVVDRAKAMALVFRLARQERDSWLNWPSRISAVMAADIGVDAGTLHTALEKFTREHLMDLSEIAPNFR